MRLMSEFSLPLKLGDDVWDRNGLHGKITNISPPNVTVLWSGKTDPEEVLPSRIGASWQERKPGEFP
jgi:hypothetical protein